MNRPQATNQPWYQPVLSAEHGASVSLTVCFLLGAFLADQWNTATTLALVTTFAGFQFPMPVTRMIRRRKIELRLAVWTVFYGLVAAIGALWLWQLVPAVSRVLVVAVAVMVVNLVWVFLRDQKSIPNEIAVFTGLCLALPLSYTAGTGFMAQALLGWWILATLVLSSSVFTVRLRLFGDKATAKAATYHIVALAIIFLLVQVRLLQPALAFTFLIPLTKLVVILLGLERYRRMKLTSIGFMETGLAILFAVWVGLVVTG